MRPGTRCPLTQIEYIDEESNRKIVNYFDENGKSKDLLALAHELNVYVPRKCSLQDLRLLLGEHHAFKKVKDWIIMVAYRRVSVV